MHEIVNCHIHDVGVCHEKYSGSGKLGSRNNAPLNSCSLISAKHVNSEKEQQLTNSEKN